MATRKMKLGLFIRPGGHHIACWRHPRAQADAGVNFPHFVEMAQIAERGLFDMLFSADNHTVWTVSESAIDRVHYSAWMEPYTLLSALSGHTKNIGLVCTASTSFEQPYTVARKFATLDLISGGRSGWNVVTSGNETEAQNFSKEPHLPKADRYRRGREFVEVVRGLWDSWDEDAFIRNKETGIFIDRSKMHELNHHGAFYDVRGPLNVARSPQGQPVVVQAGASDDGRQLAADTAEVVFSASDSIEHAREYYSDVKGRMARNGRSPDDLKVLPGLLVVVAPTRAEAEAKFETLQRPAASGTRRRALVAAARLRPHRLSARRAAAAAAGEQGGRQPLRHDQGLVGQRHADLARALSALRQLARTFVDRRHAGRRRRLHGELGRDRRLRRLQRAAAVLQRRPHRLRRSGGARAAAARHLPHGL